MEFVDLIQERDRTNCHGILCRSPVGKRSSPDPKGEVEKYIFTVSSAVSYVDAPTIINACGLCLGVNVRAKPRLRAEETLRAQKQNGGSLKKYPPSFQVGSRSVLTVARLCLGLKTENNVLSNGFQSIKSLQICDFTPNA